MTTSSNKLPVLSLFVDFVSEKPLDGLCLLNWLSKKPLDAAGVQVLSLQSASTTTRASLRNQLLQLRPTRYVAFIDPSIKINWPALATVTKELSDLQDHDCISVEEALEDDTGEPNFIRYGLGNPLQISAPPGSKACKRPANPRCLWRADLVFDINFEATASDSEFAASEFAWSIKAAARCQTTLHFPIKVYGPS